MTNLDKILDEIEERANSASEGPWQQMFCRGWIEWPNGKQYVTMHAHGPNHKEVDRTSIDRLRYDMEFIAASRTDVPELVKALRCAVSVMEYSIGPTRDIKTPKIKEALKQIESILGGEL